ncbi:RNA polymerase sigma factor [Nocardioides plantarum]|uniref:RNA polymerase sigma factor n=1 Tax=Nocardioides plantarum TaxID=29299 RepID=A0ABV5K9T7_9ACTN|nr:RNA polymerase sigma factor [Nocardioides plantarum]
MEGETELVDVSREDPEVALGRRLVADDSAIDDVYAELAPTVLAYLRRVLPPADVEDVLQRTFLDVWRSRLQYDPSRPLAGWVMGIAKHRATDLLRSRVPEPVAEVPEPDPARVEHVDHDDLVERFERSRQVRAAMGRLSPEQRQVLFLAYFNDLTLAQVADWVDAPLGTVKARAARGLRALAEQIGRDPRD